MGKSSGLTYFLEGSYWGGCLGGRASYRPDGVGHKKKNGNYFEQTAPQTGQQGQDGHRHHRISSPIVDLFHSVYPLLLVIALKH